MFQSRGYEDSLYAEAVSENGSMIGRSNIYDVRPPPEWDICTEVDCTEKTGKDREHVHSSENHFGDSATSRWGRRSCELKLYEMREC